jgi:hypothetical protein
MPIAGFSHARSLSLPMVEVGNWKPETRGRVFLAPEESREQETYSWFAMDLVTEDRNGRSTSRLSNAGRIGL